MNNTMNKLNFYTSVKHFYISLDLYKFKVNPDHHSHTVYTTFFFLIYLFWAAFGLCCYAWTFSSCSQRGYSSLRCAGFALRWLLLLRSMGSRHTGFRVVVRGLRSCGSRALEHRFSSCGAQA